MILHTLLPVLQKTFNLDQQPFQLCKEFKVCGRPPVTLALDVSTFTIRPRLNLPETENTSYDTCRVPRDNFP